jgi:hypothetical protein
MLKNRTVKLRCFAGLAIKPKARVYFIGHDIL